MSDETKEAVLSTGELYRTLSGASETLFMQIWNERKKYDTRIRNRKLASAAGGAAAGLAAGVPGGVAAGGAVGTAVTSLISAAATTISGGSAAAGSAAVAGSAAAGAVAGGLTGVIAAGALIGIGAIVGAFVINSLTKAIFDPRAANRMEANVQKCIEQFKDEVKHTRANMISQISAQITDIFKTELASVDNCFTEFRMSVNIDETRLPLLEQHLLEAENLLMRLDNI